MRLAVEAVYQRAFPLISKWALIDRPYSRGLYRDEGTTASQDGRPLDRVISDVFLVHAHISFHAQLRRAIALSLIFLFVASIPLSALAPICNATTGPKHDFQLLTGYSPASSTWIGTAEDRKFIIAGFMYSYRCWSVRAVDISYSTGVLPVAVVLQPALPNYQSLMPPLIAEHAVYGVGVLPIGFTANIGKHAVQPVLEMHGGIIASTEPVPINAPDATGLNFLFDIGTGVRFRVNDHYAISTGYKFLHISNASTTNLNPGVDNNVIFVGFSVLR